MLHSSLDEADDDRSRHEPSYSLHVAWVLRPAYACLARRRYRKACEQVTRCLAWPMSARQRMRVLYVLASAAVGERDLPAALIFLDEALGLALGLDDFAAYAELAFLHAAANSERQEFSAAAGHYDLSLDAVRALSAVDESIDTLFEVDLLIGLSTHSFFTGQLDTSMKGVEEARRLIAVDPGHRLQAAAVEWVAALNLRWRGDPGSALRHAMAAADVYAQYNLPALEARIGSVVAEIALDLAESFPDGTGHRARDAFTTLSAPYATAAVRLARTAGSATDEALALLAQTRYHRLSRRNADGTPTIEAVIQTARQLGDLPLLGQAHTALGDELAARGENEAALNCYRHALDILARSDAPVLAVWPRRKLLRASEMQI